MAPLKPQIDLTQIDFPSDRLTVKTLRERFPRAFDLPGHEVFRSKTLNAERQSVGPVLDGIIDAERLLARIVFNQATRRRSKQDRTENLRQDVVESLVADYSRLGLGRGSFQLGELIRSIETQALAQAQTQIGRSR